MKFSEQKTKKYLLFNSALSTLKGTHIGIEATEWNRSRNEYLEKGFSWSPYEYVYDNDNLIEIRWGKHTSIYIKYLY